MAKRDSLLTTQGFPLSCCRWMDRKTARLLPEHLVRLIWKIILRTHLNLIGKLVFLILFKKMTAFWRFLIVINSLSIVFVLKRNIIKKYRCVSNFTKHAQAVFDRK